jgi:hypothetical protein
MSYVKSYISRCQRNNSPVDTTFASWIENVEKIVIANLNQTLHDLPDENYVDYFDKKISAQEMAKIVIHNFRMMFNL